MSQSIPFRQQYAFTLIELLIVVAIIAILAAIAVPNFLEAQVRSKVSRAEADMRTIATALEAYAVDHNVYPLYLPPGHSGPLYSIEWRYRLLQITTPVAFLTAVPEDPFSKRTINAGSDLSGGTPVDPANADMFIYNRGDMHLGAAEAAFYGKGRWSLLSSGPDINVESQSYWAPAEVMFFEEDLAVYDTTNGTKSFGDIYRFNDETADYYNFAP